MAVASLGLDTVPHSTPCHKLQRLDGPLIASGRCAVLLFLMATSCAICAVDLLADDSPLDELVRLMH